MENDRLFAIYAAAIFLGIASVVTVMIWIGTGSFPAPAFILEHVGLGLLIRAAYKSFDGPYGIFDAKEASDELAEPAGSFGPTANPIS